MDDEAACACADLDAPPDDPADVMAAWIAEKREHYGEDWPWFQDNLRQLTSVSVHLPDVKSGNITLR